MKIKVNLKNNKKIISLFQVLAALMIFPLFFTFIPWATSYKIDKISEYPEMRKQYPPPMWAKYFTVSHGKPTYFKDSPRENPLRAILYGGSILGCILFLIISSFYLEHIRKMKETDNKKSS